MINIPPSSPTDMIVQDWDRSGWAKRSGGKEDEYGTRKVITQWAIRIDCLILETWVVGIDRVAIASMFMAVEAYEFWSRWEDSRLKAPRMYIPFQPAATEEDHGEMQSVGQGVRSAGILINRQVSERKRTEAYLREKVTKMREGSKSSKK